MQLEPRHLNRLTFSELAALVGASPENVPETDLHRVSALSDATPDSVVFAQDDLALERAVQSRAGAILARHGDFQTDDPRVLWVRDPRFAMALAGKAFAAKNEAPPIDPRAMIHPAASIGERTHVAAGAVIEAGAVVGEDCSIGANATICQGVHLGNHVIVQPGAVLGSLGFGYARNPQTGEHLLFPQQGSLVIEDDVEIGANTTIDRGALGETRIGRAQRSTTSSTSATTASSAKTSSSPRRSASPAPAPSTTTSSSPARSASATTSTSAPASSSAASPASTPANTVTGPGQIFAGTPAEPRTEYLRSLARIRRLK